MDLDLLLFDDEIHEEDDLTLPHAEMARRAFVLVPLCEIEPDVADPRTGRPYRDSLRECARTDAVRRLRRPGS
jgi:7,8-dihydro-6-hydroxymethylpterin-pyrophosphokinase